MIKSLLSPLFSRLNDPSSLNSSSQGLRLSKPHKILEVAVQECRVEKNNCLLWPYSYTALIAPQDTAGPFFLSGQLLAHIQLPNNPICPGLFLQGCSPASCLPVCTYNQNYAIPGRESSTCSCWISYIWWLHTSLVYPDLSVRPLYPLSPPSLLSTANLIYIWFLHQIIYEKSKEHWP